MAFRTGFISDDRPGGLHAVQRTTDPDHRSRGQDNRVLRESLRERLQQHQAETSCAVLPRTDLTPEVHPGEPVRQWLLVAAKSRDHEPVLASRRRRARPVLAHI